jgi:6-phosphogluconolactonase/glucosamine-6-phosphate isomerase/deaminase
MHNFIKVKDLEDGVKKIFNFSNSLFTDKKQKNIGITGGRFGKNFAMFLAENKNILGKKFFLTDERITSKKEHRNSELLGKILKKNNFLKKNQFYYFPQNFDENNLDNIFYTKFDICFLSIGNDGHLGGHFSNSKSYDDFFCITDNAEKLPRKRLSYKVEKLFLSKKIFLTAFGLEKKQALKDLFNGKGIHSKEFFKKGKKITVISDFEL